MSFKDVLGHEKPIRFLKQAIKNNKVGHSYLFLGNEGIGRKFVALQFAKAINCLNRTDEEDSCDKCLSCKKIDQNIHPDILVLEPSGQTLKVDQVREMQKDLSFQPYEGRRRICILTAADRMAPNMSNTLLKTLEEPPLHTVIILIANSERFLLPTIISRCQSIHFYPLPLPIVTRWLIQVKGFGEKEAHLLSSLSEGSLGRALEIKEEMETIQRERLLIELIGSKYLTIETMRNLLEILPSQREELILSLEVCKTLLRDLIMVKIEKNELINFDLSEDIIKISNDLDLRSLFNRMDTIHQIALALRSNANTTLALEALMISWNRG
jgi:DNA polymerase-3 subunit delta'